jgi:undecaprenyl-diphosphatase
MDAVHEQGQDTTIFDRTVLTYFHHFWNPWLNAMARLCAVLGSLEVLALVTVLGVILGSRVNTLRPEVRLMPIAALGSLLLLNIIKFSIHRVRPALFPALFDATGYSFPSGHAFLSLVIYGLFGYFLLQLPQLARVWHGLIRLFIVLLILIIGISRAYAGVHFPSDVLGGWLLGVPCLHCLILWSKRIQECQEQRAS